MSSVGAKETTTIYVVGDIHVDGALKFDDIVEAFAAALAKNKLWGADEQLEIQFKGSISAGAQNGLVFGLTTIWRQDGTKLPITIRGVDTDMPRDAFIYVDSAGGWYACANDYTFVNLTIPIADQKTEFYAGSGHIKFEEVLFKNRNAKIPNEATRTVFQNLIHNTAEAVASRNSVDLLPVGDLWWELSHSEDAAVKEIGDNLWRGEGSIGPWGDYKHDGSIGGGQYLNACLWFEYLTKTSCVGNPWRPHTAPVARLRYTLEENFIHFLQNAAHNFMLKKFGAEYFAKPYCPNSSEGDGTLNVLIIGSSNCYYFPDELCAMANAAGFHTRVCVAYSSGIRLSTQWSWASSGGGDYEFLTYEADGTFTKMRKQKFTDFLGLYDWDAISLYQTSNFYSDYGISMEQYDKYLEGCISADYLYAYLRESYPDARYVYYQVAACPIGFPGAAFVGIEGHIFADTCTDAVFAGWPALKAGEKIETSVTFGEGTEYNHNGSVDGQPKAVWLAAVGFMSDYGKDTPWTDEEAKEICYPTLEGYGAIPPIRPSDVSATLILDGCGFRAHYVCAKYGSAPTDATVWMKRGTVYGLDCDRFGTDALQYYWGNIRLRLSGGTVTTDISAQNKGNVKGDVSVLVEKPNLDTPADSTQP